MDDTTTRVLSTKEAAAFLGVSRTEVQRAIARGILPFVDRAPAQPRLGVTLDALVAFADRPVELAASPTVPARDTASPLHAG
ncbi:helix-turn-helix domain-containing protein [Pseudoclavibacter chungangensis]|uniref:Helix-turn-helix domain-containing protein n=1 Tax=Pseudoclavibacter chungangensis TaxID=587635 RepID=A0A7J5BQ55_9MICO|nr:helix-turn-helix domain-containing protein [Pseudoclavibacter chungangensis]KAB1654795.1 helix-turn-helix domain-containing protein [Pseudoclavibacter chungangensis]NYJ68092.1 putative DNA-binding transcriptional regulator AlpA [Pseudoclavibacter chungangensis]